VVKLTQVGVKLLSLIQSTSTHIIVGMLTAKTGSHSGSYSGLEVPGPLGEDKYLRTECCRQLQCHHRNVNMPVRHQLVQEAAQGPQIASEGVLLVLPQLRWHVVGGANLGVGNPSLIILAIPRSPTCNPAFNQHSVYVS